MGWSIDVSVPKSGSQGRFRRDAQFHYINDLRQWYRSQGLPSLSVDTKKKELIGNFKKRPRLAARARQGLRPRLPLRCGGQDGALRDL